MLLYTVVVMYRVHVYMFIFLCGILWLYILVNKILYGSTHTPHAEVSVYFT